MTFHVGIHVLHPDVGSDSNISSSGTDDNTDSSVANNQQARKPRKKRNESAPQDESQLNEADPSGSVGGDAT